MRLISRTPLVALCATLLLAACDGSQDRRGSGGTTDALGGLVAVGAPVVGAKVELRCTSGESTADTDGDGRWQVEVPAGATPCVIKASGGTPPVTLYSYAEAPGTVNVTPLTTLAVAHATGTTDLEAWFDSSNPADPSLGDAVAGSRDHLLALLHAADYPVPVGLDPFTSDFAPTAGDPHDDLLEALAAALDGNGQSFEALIEAFVADESLPESEPEPQGPAPVITLTSPADAAVLAQVNAEGRVPLALVVSVDNFDLANGGWRLYIGDDLQSGSHNGGSGSYEPILSPGRHALRVELLDAEHRPLDPPVFSVEVLIDVTAFVTDTVSPPQYTVSGSISGATGTLTWETHARGGIYHDGQHGNGPVEFTYGEGLEEGTPYIIIVSYPPSGQTCAVANGDGTLMDDVTNVEILCVDEDPEVEPDPGESGSGFRELANGVAFTRMDKPEGLDVYALGYVRDADGAGRVLFSRPVDISGALTNVRAYHFAHYKADGSLDTSKGDAGITRVCGDCSADHPLWQWNGAENQFAWNLSVAAVLPDGRMIAVLASRAVKGFENSYFPMHDRALVRFTREGELDTSFGEQGVLPLQFEGEPVRFYSFAGSSIPISHQPDANGHLLVFVGHARLLKIDMDGSIVTGFADNGVLTMERSSAPHQFLLDTEGDIFIFRQTTTMSAIGVAAGTQTNVSDTYTIGSYRLAAHPHGGALMIRKDNPTAPTHILHLGGDGEEIASVQVDVGMLHRDGQFIWLDDNRLLFTALGSDSSGGAVSRAFVVYDVGLNAIDNPYADNCGESDAGCSQRFSSEVVYPLPDGTVRHPHAGGSAWSGFIQEGDGTFYHFYDDFDAWVLTRFPKH